MNTSDPPSQLPPPPPLHRETSEGSSLPTMQAMGNSSPSKLLGIASTETPISAVGHSHIPVKSIPGPTHHKIAQPMRQSEPAQTLHHTFPSGPQLMDLAQKPPQQSLSLSVEEHVVLQEQSTLNASQKVVPTPDLSGSPINMPITSASHLPSESLGQVSPTNASQKEAPTPDLSGTPVKMPITSASLPPSESLGQATPEPSGDIPVKGTPPELMCTPTKQSSIIPTPPSDPGPIETSETASPEIKIKIKKTVSRGKPSLTSTLLSTDESPQKTSPSGSDTESATYTKRNLMASVERELPVDPTPTKPPTVAQRRDTVKAAKGSSLPIPKGHYIKQPLPINDEKPCEWLVGDLVWSKVSGHPWWPCMVAYDPNLGIYTRMKGSIGKAYRMYHVQFFGEVPERGWVSGSSMKKFSGRDQYDSLVEEMVSKVRKAERSRMLSKLAVKPCRRNAWDAAISECERALPMSRHERKLNFTFKYDMPKAGPAGEQIDIVSLGDSPKMKAKRAYKKQKEDAPTPDASGDALPQSKQTPGTTKKAKYEPDTPKRKRGRKTSQFLEFSKQYKKEIVKEHPGIGQREIYEKLQDKWEGLSEEDKEKYNTKPVTPPSTKRERKRKSPPEQDTQTAPVKRSKRESKPSKKLQEADLSSLGFSPKVVASIKKYSEASQSESTSSDGLLSPSRETVPPKKGRGRPLGSFKPVPSKEPSITKQSRPRKSLPAPEDTKPAKKRRGKQEETPMETSTKPDVITSDMSQDFAEMQEEDDEGGLIIDTDIIADAIQSVTDRQKGNPPSEV
nr:histone-lysine N-methyltransferase NSD2-like [Lytechinus pictus]